MNAPQILPAWIESCSEGGISDISALESIEDLLEQMKDSLEVLSDSLLQAQNDYGLSGYHHCRMLVQQSQEGLAFIEHLQRERNGGES